jgi:hypothetical protein
MSDDRSNQIHAPTGPPGVRRISGRGRPFILVAIMALVVPIVVAAAQQNGLDAPSPASGHASVLAQGIVEFPEGEFVCRVVQRVAQPLGTAQYEDQHLGFVIATDGPLLLADEVNGVPQQVARLAVGELYLVQEGTKQRRASIGDDPVNYSVLEIVPATEVDEVGDGELIIATDPIGTPSGYRDLDLVQDVLAFNERSEVTDAGAGMVILATDGAVEVVPRGGRPRTLEEGEIGIFPEGVDVTAVEAPGGNAKSGGLSALSSALGHQTPQGGASFLACVVGPEVPPLEQSPSIVPRDVPGPGAGSDLPDDSPPEEEADVVDDGDDDVEEPEPTVTLTTEDDLAVEPTPTTGPVFRTPAVLVIQEPEPTLEPEG